MFDFSWSELVIVALVGLLVIGPKELPTIMRSCKKIIKKIKEASSEFTSAITDMEEVDDIKQEAEKINKDIKKIVDLDGNMQETYDMSDIMPDIKKANKANKKKNSSKNK